MRTFPVALAGTILLLSACDERAAAADLRDFCPDRPGLGTPACTIDPGHGDVELGLVDWSSSREGDVRTRDIAYGDILLRYGLSSNLEAQLHWTAIGTERVRERGMAASHDSGTGDLSLALRRNLVHPDGAGFSAALMPVLTLPTGDSPLGGGTWGASLVVPVSYQLPGGVQLDFTSHLDASPDQDGRGRHLAFGGIAGLNLSLADNAIATVELAASRDDDPSGHEDQLLGGLSLAWLARPSLQLDAGTNLGLAGHAADIEVYVGISRRF